MLHMKLSNIMFLESKNANIATYCNSGLLLLHHLYLHLDVCLDADTPLGRFGSARTVLAIIIGAL